jgi:hypothetical protein
MTDHQLDMLAEGNRFLKEIYNENAPKIIIVPNSKYIIVPVNILELKLENYLAFLLSCHVFNVDNHNANLEIKLAQFYLDKKAIEDNIAKKADLSMKLVSEYRGET